MKKITLIAGICFVNLLAVSAQQTTLTFDQKVDKLMNELTSACNLTPSQALKVKPIVEETIKARMANKQQYGSDKGKLKAANQANLAAENTKMNAILNAEQQTKLYQFEKTKQAEAQKRQQITTNKTPQ